MIAGLVLPRIGSRRHPRQRTLGGLIAGVADEMGMPLHVWQGHAADVGTELELRRKPGSKYRLAASNVAVLCGRQQGKTVLTCARIMTQALLPELPEAGKLVGLKQVRPQRIGFTAQDRANALIHFREHCDLIMSSDLRDTVRRVYLQRGDERIAFKNGSVVSVFTPTRAGGRGQSWDLAIIDEARSHPVELLAAIRPTLSARDQAAGCIGAQLWATSNAGSITSTLLNHTAELGRRAALEDDRSRVWMEWSIGPDDDPLDEAVWHRVIPTLNQGGVALEFLRIEAETLGPDAFATEYLCRTTLRDPDVVIHPAAWRSLPRVELMPGHDLVLAVDAPVDRSSSSIVAAAMVDDVIGLEVIEQRDGTDWLGPFLIELLGRWPSPVVIDGYGPVSALAGQLQRAGLDVVTIGVRQVAEAAQLFVDAVAAGRIGHVDDFRLNDAVAAVGRRKIGDRWGFDRRGDDDVSPLIAASFAALHVETRRARTPRIHVWKGPPSS